MKNRLSDLVDHLFSQCERLNDEALQGERLREEISRSGAMSVVARQIIDAGELALKAADRRLEHGSLARMPGLLGLDKEGQA
jgi:hypothetical protein